MLDCRLDSHPSSPTPHCIFCYLHRNREGGMRRKRNAFWSSLSGRVLWSVWVNATMLVSNYMDNMDVVWWREGCHSLIFLINASFNGKLRLLDLISPQAFINASNGSRGDIIRLMMHTFNHSTGEVETGELLKLTYEQSSCNLWTSHHSGRTYLKL